MKAFIIGAVLTLPMIASANPYGYGMMGYGSVGTIGFFAIVTWLVWTAVGILAAMWLWQQVKKGR